MRQCIYITAGWGVHDERWVDALRTQGFQSTIIRLGIDVPDAEALRARVVQAAAPDTPILAGPLESVTKPLIGIRAPIIGLSWGFDLHEMADRAWLTSLDGLIIDSPATVALAERAGVDPDRITYLPWGVDLELFRREGPSQDFSAWDVPKDARIMLSLRAHEPRYRVADTLDGFAQVSQTMPDLHLVIGNTGSLTADLHARARNLDIAERTHFIGSIPEDQLPTLLRGADIYVSASEVDGTSVTMLQAMACGTPVLVSDTPGNTAWVEPGETGYLYRTGQAPDLAQVLTELTRTDATELLRIRAKATAQVSAQANWRANISRLGSALETSVQR